MSKIKKIKKQQILGHMLRIKTPQALLVGGQSGSATMKISVAAPQTLEIDLPRDTTV